MTYKITLKRTHQIVLLEALADSCDYKISRLRNRDSISKMTEYYLDAATKIRDGQIEVRHPQKNLTAWMRDQFYHSGQLATTELGRMAIAICESISDQEYEIYCRAEILGKLFVEKNLASEI